MTFIEVTDAINLKKIWVNAEMIISIYEVENSTIIYTVETSATLQVKETPQEILAKIPQT